MRTAKDLGIKTVAVYSEPDSNAQHVKMVTSEITVRKPQLTKKKKKLLGR